MARTQGPAGQHHGPPLAASTAFQDQAARRRRQPIGNIRTLSCSGPQRRALAETRRKGRAASPRKPHPPPEMVIRGTGPAESARPAGPAGLWGSTNSHRPDMCRWRCASSNLTAPESAASRTKAESSRYSRIPQPRHATKLARPRRGSPWQGRPFFAEAPRAAPPRGIRGANPAPFMPQPDHEHVRLRNRSPSCRWLPETAGTAIRPQTGRGRRARRVGREKHVVERHKPTGPGAPPPAGAA